MILKISTGEQVLKKYRSVSRLPRLSKCFQFSGMWSWGRWRSVTGSCVLSAGSAREVAPGIRALARERCSARRVSCQASLLRLETWGIQGHREPPSGPGRCLPHPPITPAVARGGDERVSGYPDDVCESWAPRCLEGPLTV